MRRMLLLFCTLFSITSLSADTRDLLILRDAAGVATPIRTADQWQTRRTQILQNMERVMGPLPGDTRRVPLDPKVLSDVDKGTYRRLSLTIAVEKDDRLPVIVLIPKETGVKRPAMLCLHPTTREHGKAVVVGDPNSHYKADVHYALELVARGYVVLAPDYVNMGEYRCDPYRLGYTSATMKGIWNHMRCVDYLQSRPDVDGRRIGTIGHSLGGHNSIFLGVFDERIRVVVSSCGFCSFPTYMKGNLAGWSHDGYMPRIRTEFQLKPDRMPWDFPEALAAIAPRGVYACAPKDDNNFDRQGGRRLYPPGPPGLSVAQSRSPSESRVPRRQTRVPGRLATIGLRLHR
jgi:Prolyl oligopeptidase family